MAQRTLIRGASIVTMDAQGDLPVGDLLVAGDTIEAIAPQLAVDDAQVVDASGCILVPGFINAHMHTWQTALRGVAAKWTLLQYFKNMHAGLATVFAPDDLHIATLVGALNQLNCGTTTLVDWCHNNPTPAHNDAAVSALLQSGIRAAFFHGTPKPDPKPGQTPFWEVPHPRAGVGRTKGRPWVCSGSSHGRCWPAISSSTGSRRSPSRTSSPTWLLPWPTRSCPPSSGSHRSMSRPESPRIRQRSSGSTASSRQPADSRSPPDSAGGSVRSRWPGR